MIHLCSLSSHNCERTHVQTRNNRWMRMQLETSTWEQVPGEMILSFQYDSMMCAKSTKHFEDFSRFGSSISSLSWALWCVSFTCLCDFLKICIHWGTIWPLALGIQQRPFLEEPNVCTRDYSEPNCSGCRVDRGRTFLFAICTSFQFVHNSFCFSCGVFQHTLDTG